MEGMRMESLKILPLQRMYRQPASVNEEDDLTTAGRSAPAAALATAATSLVKLFDWRQGCILYPIRRTW